jgi:hypothetical protein
MEAQLPLDNLFRLGLLRLYIVDARGIVLQELRQGVAHQRMALFEVPADDGFLFGMRGQPSSALVDKLIDFLAADEVVLGGVERRNEDVEVGEQIR